VREDIAVQRLREALDEQARLTERWEQAIGTAGEMTAYVRLQAARLAVTNCDRLARGDEWRPS
jgi:hypothetical protein